jgi:hypothetical protein
MKNLIFILLFLSSNVLFGQKLQDSDIDECSGLVVSSQKDNLLWVHNDSGDKSRVFLINNKGETQAVYNYNKEVIDCEDIAMNYPKNGKPQLFVGDIGDNRSRRDYISIYKFDEPNLAIKSTNEIAINKVEELDFKYPDGPRDAECLMIDQRDQKIYIVSKREDNVGLYSAPLNSKSGNMITLKKEMKLSFPGGPGSKWITAGDISRDGKEIVIKSYIYIFYWDRKANESIPQCLKRAFIGLPYNPEKQGEAIGFTKDGRSYYTISEGKHAEIHFKRI